MRAIVDAGPLVALFDRRERHHRWVGEQLTALDPPLLVCEAVMTEALHLSFRGGHNATTTLLSMVEADGLRLAFDIAGEVVALRQLAEKYRDRPMSLADACIVRMAERYDDHAVLTFDSDFAFYRKNGRTPIRLIHPTLS